MTQALSNNVVEFPKHKIIRDGSLNSDEIKKMKTRSLENFADALVQEITENLLMDFDNYGIDMDKPETEKDFNFFVSVLSAVVYRSLDLRHDFHNFLDTHVKVIDIKDAEEDIEK